MATRCCPWGKSPGGTDVYALGLIVIAAKMVAAGQKAVGH
jgi:hypothetical protein